MIKRKYIKPSIVIVNTFEEECLLAGTKDFNVDKPGSGNSDGDEDNRAKEVNSEMSSWNTDWVE